MPPTARVYLELGPKWVFAAALDWPGWCRRGRDEDALDVLLDYADRYAAVAGPGFAPGELEVVGRVARTAYARITSRIDRCEQLPEAAATGTPRGAD